MKAAVSNEKICKYFDIAKNYIRLNRIEIISIFSITLIALFLRIYAINNLGDFVIDEVYSWYYVSRNSVLELIKESIAQGINTPLYYIIAHFWIKFFNNNPTSMHYCSLLLSLPLIPLSYYLIKSLFNKTAGYFCAIYFALNTFSIYYSIEARFYSFVLTLALLLGFLFVKLLEKFEKKYIISFIAISLILIYTYSLSSFLLFFYAVVGFSYVLIKKRNAGEFILTYLIITLFSLPALVFTFNNHVILANNICSYAKDLYSFSWHAIYDILENFFSNENYQLINRTNNIYRDLFDNIFNLKYFVLVVIPVAICLFGLIKAVVSKNLRIILYISPIVLTLIYIILLSSANALMYQTRYLAMLFPAIICTVFFGLSLIRNKILSIILFSLLIYLNIMHLFLNPNNILSYRNVEIANLNTVVNNISLINDNDIILAPYSSNKIKMYIKKGKLIPFSFNEALILKDKKSLEFYFGKKLSKKLTRNNAKEELSQYILENKIPESYKDNLDSYLDSMQNNQKLIIISLYENKTKNNSIDNEINETTYKNKSLYSLLMSKVIKDSQTLAQKKLTLVNQYKDSKRNYTIYTYQKH